MEKLLIDLNFKIFRYKYNFYWTLLCFLPAERETKIFNIIMILRHFLAAKRPEKYKKNLSDMKKFIKKLQFDLKFWYFSLKNNIFDDLFFHRSKNANNNFKLIKLVFFRRIAAGKLSENPLDLKNLINDVN